MEIRVKLRKLKIVSISILVLTFGIQPPASKASSSESYNFNTTGDLANNFDATVSSGSYSQTSTGGIGNSGAINAPSSLSAIFATKNSYSIGSVGSTYTFSSYMQSIGNSGYSGMGFSATPSTASGNPYRPNDALGISVHGGGFVFHNSGTNYSAQWDSNSSGSITAVKKATIFDLLNNGSADDWYKVIFKVEVLASSKFTIRVEVWPASGTDGSLRETSAAAIYEVREISNASISGAANIKSYINFSGYRVVYFDNFTIDLAGNASVVSAGYPVVVTNTETLSGNQVTFNGNVTSDNGSSVTERGFVYSTSVNPTVSDNKVTVGTGLGTFSETVSGLSPATYYARTFATNSIGTSYGSSITFTITGPPVTAPDAPTLNSVTAGDRRVIVAFTAGATGGSTITDYEYSLNGGSYISAGTTSSPFTITGLDGRTSYSVTLKARNSVGLGSASSSLSATTTDATLDASEAAAEVAAAKRKKEQQELTELFSLIPELAKLALNLGETSKSITTQKCKKGGKIKIVKAGAKCPTKFRKI